MKVRFVFSDGKRYFKGYSQAPYIVAREVCGFLREYLFTEDIHEAKVFTLRQHYGEGVELVTEEKDKPYFRHSVDNPEEWQPVAAPMPVADFYTPVVFSVPLEQI